MQDLAEVEARLGVTPTFDADFFEAATAVQNDVLDSGYFFVLCQDIQ